ncbi:MAG: ABC transporter permease [Ilumatobacteraceae bacterium]
MPRLPNATATRRRGVPRWARRLLGPALLLGAWVALSHLGVISESVFASPGRVWDASVDLVSTGQLQHHLWVSLQRVLVGLFFGISIGVALAVIAGLFQLGEDLIDGPMQILRSLPVLALPPLMILWFGIGEEPKIVLIAFGVAFPVYVNTFAAIRGVDGRLVESAHVAGLGRLGLIRHVILPGALPGFFTGLRFAFAVSWLILVVGEQINATSGIGYLAMTAREFLRTDVIVVCLIVYGLLGFTSDALVRLIERSALQWRPTFTGT